MEWKLIAEVVLFVGPHILTLIDEAIKRWNPFVNHDEVELFDQEYGMILHKIEESSLILEGIPKHANDTSGLFLMRQLTEQAVKSFESKYLTGILVARMEQVSVEVKSEAFLSEIMRKFELSFGIHKNCFVDSHQSWFNSIMPGKNIANKRIPIVERTCSWTFIGQRETGCEIDNSIRLHYHGQNYARFRFEGDRYLHFYRVNCNFTEVTLENLCSFRRMHCIDGSLMSLICSDQLCEEWCLQDVNFSLETFLKEEFDISTKLLEYKTELAGWLFTRSFGRLDLNKMRFSNNMTMESVLHIRHWKHHGVGQQSLTNDIREIWSILRIVKRLVERSNVICLG
jgi:hypothetical protein